MSTPSNNGAVIAWGRRAAYGANNRCGAHIDIATGTVTEIDATNGTLNAETIATFAQDGANTPYLQSGFAVQYVDPEYNNTFAYIPRGLQVDANGTDLILGAAPTAMDGSNMFGFAFRFSPTFRYGFPARNPSTIGGTSAKAYYWKFYTGLTEYQGIGTEWRLRFASRNIGIRTTDWLAWRCTGAEIKTAIDAIFDANTEGITDNVTINPFGEPAALTNNSSLLERNLEIVFAGANTLSYIQTQFLTAGRITIETRNVAPVNTRSGIGAWSRTTGAEVWTRGFAAVDSGDAPNLVWLRGDYVYAIANQPVPAET